MTFFVDHELEQKILTKVPDWRTYTLNIETDRGTLDLRWKSVESLAFYTTYQIGLGNHGPVSLQNFYNLHARMRQEEWSRNEGLGAYTLLQGAKVLDIGCGVGINGLLISKYEPTATVDLLDKDAGYSEVEGQPRELMNGFSDNYPFYNSTALTHEAMEYSDIDTSRVNLITPDSPWQQYDLIMSTWSYCWHYSIDTYWERVKKHLKPGGKLLLDVLHEETVNTITAEFGTSTVSDYPTGMVCGNSRRYIWTRY